MWTNRTFTITNTYQNKNCRERLKSEWVLWHKILLKYLTYLLLNKEAKNAWKDNKLVLHQ